MEEVLESVLINNRSKKTLQTQNDPVHLVNAMAHPEVKARAEDVVAYTASYAEAEGGI